MTTRSNDRVSSARAGDADAAARLPDLIASLAAVVWEKDPSTGRFTYVSDRAAELFGHPVARWLEEPTFWQEGIVHPEDRHLVMRLHEDAFPDGTGQLSYRARTADGGVLWLRDIVRRTVDEAGNDRLAGLTLDITEEKSDQDRTLQLSGILERITDAFFALDRGWRFTYVNQQAERLLRREAGELIGETIWDRFPEARGTTFWEVYQRAMEAGRTETFQEYYPPLDAWYEVNVYPSGDGLSVYFRDVTAQKLASQQTERNQARLLLALDAGRMGTWEWDIRTNEVIWAPEEERLYGLEPGTFGGTVEEYTSRIHPEDRAKSWAILDEAMRNRAEGHHVVHRIVRPTGEVRWLDSHGRFVYAEDGTPQRLVGVSTDVTERMRFERLRERQDEMLGAVDIGLWYCDIPFDVLEWDAKVKEQFWLPKDALVTVETFYARLHPDDQDRTREAIALSIASNTPYDIEYRTLAPADSPQAGQVRWLRAIGYTAYRPDGMPVRFDGITVDVTEQKLIAERLAASEQRYEYASRATSNAIWDWDLTTDEVRWNPGVYRVFGYDREEVDEDANWWYEHIHPEDSDRVVSSIHEAIASVDGTTDWKEEYRYRRRDGSYAWIVDRGHIARDESGRAVRMIGAMEDVTDKREAEEAERHARAEAEEANLAKSQFLARMSHDLRTPLNAIGGYTQLLEMGVQGTISERQKESLARIQRATDHLLTLINDILSFARLEAGQVRIDPTEMPIGDTLRELNALFQPEAERRGVSLRVEVPTVKAIVRADRNRMLQVLGNITSNALKFTDPGGEVRVWSEAREDEVSLHVMDNGIGIPASRLQSIFEPFVQARGTDDERREGVGLGLAISHELARLMNAEITARSEEGKGSTFTLTLARIQGGAAAPPM